MLQIPELLAPAGDLERLRYAINYGAAAGDQNCYTLHTSSTPSPSTMVPRR